ncbi:hypothetical protein IMZ48_35545 [Candidatus Bathyarchaeota archaeon]|nr:hypothetical protein [Candidatus Bathyarchaeota archaeon]
MDSSWVRCDESGRRWNYKLAEEEDWHRGPGDVRRKLRRKTLDESIGDGGQVQGCRAGALRRGGPFGGGVSASLAKAG